MSSEASIGLRAFLIDEFSEGFASISDLLSAFASQAQAATEAFASAMDNARASESEATDAAEANAAANEQVAQSADSAAASTEAAGEAMAGAAEQAQNMFLQLAPLTNLLLGYPTSLVEATDATLGFTEGTINLSMLFPGFVTGITEIADEFPLLTAGETQATETTTAFADATSQATQTSTSFAGAIFSATQTAQDFAFASQEADISLLSLDQQLDIAFGKTDAFANQLAFANQGLEGVKDDAMAAEVAMGGLTEETTNTSTAMSGGYGRMMALMMAAMATVQGINSLASGAMGLQSTLTQVGIASDATGKALDSLDAAVISVADNSKFTTAEVGAAFALIMERGYGATDTVNHLGQAVVNLAEATSSDLNPSAVLLSATMQTFGAKAQDAERYASALTFAFYHGIPSVTELQTAMQQVGGVAATLGVPIEDVAATLDYLSRQGLSATTAGSSLRYMLQGIVDPTSKASEELANLGIVTLNVNPALKALVAHTDAVAEANKKTPAAFTGTLSSLSAVFTQAKALGVIKTDQTFYQWALQAGFLNDKLFDMKGNFVGLPETVKQLGQAIEGLPQDQKLAALQQLFNIRGGQGADHLLQDIGKAFPQLQALIAGMKDAEAKNTAAADAQKVMSDANNQLQALKTTVGSALEQAFLPFMQAVGGLASKLNMLIGPLTSASGPAHDFLTAFLPLIAGGGIMMLVLAFGSLLAPLVAIAMILVPIASGFALLWTGIKEGNPYLIAIGSAIGLIGVLLLAAWVPGMFAGAAANFAFMAPLLPIIGIILAVTAVILGIILVVTHWGQIAHWLQGVWKPIGAWLSGFWHGVQNAWNTAIHAIGNVLGAVFHGIVSLLGKYITMMVNYFKLPVTAMQWLYNHNYYVKDFVDAVVGFFKMLGSFAVTLWNGLLAFFKAIPNAFKVVWDSIINDIHARLVVPFQTFLQILLAVVQLAFNNLTAPFRTFASWVGSWAPGVLHAIGSGFSAFGSFLHTWLVVPVQNLGSTLLTAGSNLMKMVAQGIAAGASWVVNAVKNAAGGILKFLGFHSPTEEGPGSDADTWAPNLMKMYAGGILSHAHLVTGAVSHVASGIATGFATPSVARLQTAGAQAQAAGNQTSVFNLNMDSKKIGEIQVNHLTGQLQLNGLNKAWR